MMRVENGWDEDWFLENTIWLASLDSWKQVKEPYTEWLEYVKWYVGTTSFEMDMCAIIKETRFPPQWAYYWSVKIVVFVESFQMMHESSITTCLLPDILSYSY